MNSKKCKDCNGKFNCGYNENYSITFNYCHKFDDSVPEIFCEKACAFNPPKDNFGGRLKLDGNVKSDNVVRPNHYSSNGLTPVEAFERGLLSRDEVIGFLRGNVIKYVVRFDKKGGCEDLDKAVEYINLLKEYNGWC